MGHVVLKFRTPALVPPTGQAVTLVARQALLIQDEPDSSLSEVLPFWCALTLLSSHQKGAIQSFSGSLLSPAPVPSSRVQIQSTVFWGAVCLCQGHGLLAVEVSALSPGVLALCLLSAGHLPQFSEVSQLCRDRAEQSVSSSQGLSLRRWAVRDHLSQGSASAI